MRGFLLCSRLLRKHWNALDRFEGEAYARKQLVVQLADGVECLAWAYVGKEDPLKHWRTLARTQQSVM